MKKTIMTFLSKCRDAVNPERRPTVMQEDEEFYNNMKIAVAHLEKHKLRSVQRTAIIER